MTNPSSEISLGKFALIAGISMVLMGTTPYAEFWLFNFQVDLYSQANWNITYS
jgi:hypothetical protein